MRASELPPRDGLCGAAFQSGGYECVRQEKFFAFNGHVWQDLNNAASAAASSCSSVSSEADNATIGTKVWTGQAPFTVATGDNQRDTDVLPARGTL